MDESERFSAAIEGIDQANSPVPGEVLYSQRMTEWLRKLYPEASEALCLAARAQHIRDGKCRAILIRWIGLDTTAGERGYTHFMAMQLRRFFRRLDTTRN